MDCATLPQLTRYRCHNIVEAARIQGVKTVKGDKSVLLTLAPGHLWAVDWAWAEKHLPRSSSTTDFFLGVDGYFVKQEDGDACWMSKGHFERNYLQVHGEPMRMPAVSAYRPEDPIQLGLSVREVRMDNVGKERNRWSGAVGLVLEEQWRCPRHGEINGRVMLAFLAGKEGPWCLQCTHEAITSAQILRCSPTE